MSLTDQGLKRGVKSRQLMMIAFGSSIGTGLFLGSAGSIQYAGPAVLISFALVGVIGAGVLLGRQLFGGGDDGDDLDVGCAVRRVIRIKPPADLVDLGAGAFTRVTNTLPSRLPVGVVTGALGAPYLIYLIIRANRTGNSS